MFRKKRQATNDGLLSRLAPSVVVELFGTFLSGRLIYPTINGQALLWSFNLPPMPTMTAQPTRVFNGSPCAPPTGTKSSICCQINRRTLMLLRIRFIPSSTVLRKDRGISTDDEHAYDRLMNYDSLAEIFLALTLTLSYLCFVV